ncbi:type II 3-dehydroquinate dehydratase [Paracoccus sulfuroxidans]|uniref:3-dehydroquinate dehydratase n=1 Tax=Paracoccus sulfuroxidans TaxID=384678 RepID=A0A562NFP6_9RHOB|nr:type II 3-dehydroquinate dehydratase [Paracoccus sulfuroxidans]TWI30956.1 3-dehydroquinate dehydratase [Paracoccus sulfuroxidans]
MPDILLINGPNLGRLGQRKPEIYGSVTLAEIERCVQSSAAGVGLSVDCFQSDVEGEIIRYLNGRRDAQGLILNPGALMMSGWCLRDCLEDCAAIKIEVHISNIFAREQFRTQSVLAGVMNGMIAGLGARSYQLALTAIRDMLPEGRGLAG